MVETVIKRDGSKQAFNKEKIEIAIYKAIMSTRPKLSEKKVKDLSELAASIVVFKLNEKGDTIIHLEEIQNAVEETLMALGMTDVARSYIRYRFQRELARGDRATAISVEKMMSSYITQDDWLVKENANMDYSLQGLNNYIVSEITKNFWLNHIYSANIREAHENGDIHIHDLYFIYILLWVGY